MLEAPPGIPRKRSHGGSNMERAAVGYHEDAFDLKPHLWSQLPEHLLHSVLARLPFQSVLRFRCVCMQWRALFGSPTFHHFASHRSHIPPWIFFLASSIRVWTPSTQYDAGHDNNGYVFEEDAHEDIHDEDDEHGGSHVVSYVIASDDPRDAHDVVRHGDQVEMDDAVICEDHGGDMHDVSRCGDHGNTLGVDCCDDDNANANALEVLFLIFDCESESWHSPLAMPPGMKAHTFLNSDDDACSFQEQVLIPADRTRIFLFNPASPSCKELPPCICIKEFHGLGLSEERTVLSSSGTLTNLSLSVEKRQASFLQVVAIGESKGDAYGQDTYVVESFNFMTGSWRVCGYFQQSDDNMLIQTQMVFCNGSFYARVSSGILTINNLFVGRNVEYTLRYFPSLCNRDGAEDRALKRSCLLATKRAVFLVGVTHTWSQEDWDVIIWQFHLDAPQETCWQLLAYTPKSILNDFYGGGIHFTTIYCRAHGDLIFFQVPDRQRFLIYDVSHKVWRFSAKCKYFLLAMSFVWEPLLRN